MCSLYDNIYVLNDEIDKMSILLFLFKLFYFMYVYFACMYVYALCACLVCLEARRGYEIHWT